MLIYDTLAAVWVGVAEWLAHGSGEVSDPSSNPPMTATDFSDIAEWPKNTHMLPITLQRQL